MTQDVRNMSDRVRPFSCGTQDADWTTSNCERCTKSAADDSTPTCPIELALLDAFWDDGTVSAEIAKRMGYVKADQPRYVWKCGEVEWTEAWKAEFKLRQQAKAEEAQS